MKKIESRVKEIISKHMGISKVEGNEHLWNDIGIDSLDIVEITMELEEAYMLKIPDDDAMEWKTVDDVIKYIGQTR